MMDHFENTVILRDFSTSGNSSKKEPSENELEYVENIVQKYNFRYYANGNCEKNKGYVSIISCEATPLEKIIYDNLEGLQVYFFFSVVDASGGKRFTQSIVYISDTNEPLDITEGSRSNSHFGLERYLRRETLLNDPAELLPGDCLTILVEIDYIFYSSRRIISLMPHSGLLKGKFEFYMTQKAIEIQCREFYCYRDKYDRVYIPLDTIYGRKLCNLSGFFRLASETSLTNCTTRQVHIPNEELTEFYNILHIIFGPYMMFDINSILDVCHLYVISDKYDIQWVIKTCRQFIKAFLRTAGNSKVREHVAQNVSGIIELADEYRDSDLKDTVKIYLECKESFGMNSYALGKCLKQRISSDWKCVSVKSKFRFLFSKLSKIMKPEFESYL